MSTEKDYLENLSQTLNVLADKLGVKAEELFQTVPKQAKIELTMNIIYLVLSVLMFVSGIFLVNYLIPFWESDKIFSPGKQTVVMMATVMSVIFIVIPILFTLTIVKDIVTLKLNPKYWALKDILSLIKH